MIPTRKISLTLIEYAQPLIQSLPDGYSKTDLETVLKLATCVWNACVLDQWHRSTENVAAVRSQISPDPGSAALVEVLIERKQRMFGNDPRAVTGETVVVKNGEFVVRAEARLDVQHVEIQGSVN
jgi:hypothetical protein